MQMSAGVRDVLKATTTENVVLIKSIPQQHLTQVETLVMRSVAQGGNLAELKRELLARYDISAKRAGLMERVGPGRVTARCAAQR